MSDKGQDIPFIDIHTHRLRDYNPGILSLYNVLYPDLLPEAAENLIFTIGLHPWHIDRVDFNPAHFTAQAARPEVAAIGETGIDRLRGPGLERQTRLFSAQAETAGRMNKPVIIHCVRAWDELIAVKRNLQPGKAWIIHGFRGKPETALRLTGEGFYLSFGEILLAHLEPVAGLFRQIPADRIFLETDESVDGIEDIYRVAARIRNVTLPDLKSQIASNFNHVFGFHATS